MRTRVLLLSAYDARSHRLWRERLGVLFPDYDWVQLSLPPRHFNWRIRGNSLQWAYQEASTLRQDFDLLIATSMVDLASLRGFIPPLGDKPSIVYFHENQFVYPKGSQKEQNVEPLLVPLYTALCADRIVFNSEYNRRTFLKGVRSLFQRLPDRIPEPALHRLQESLVIPVPLIEAESATLPARQGRSLEVVWNHRWEYDKGIDLLLALVGRIAEQKLPLRLHVVGEQFRERPAQFDRIGELLNKHAENLAMAAGEFGFIADPAQYAALLASCDVVLSTALHDFQGLAVQEAVVAGCTPLAPDALVYPEYLDKQFLYPPGENDGDCAATIVARLMHWQQQRSAGHPLPRAALQRYGSAVVRKEYERLFVELLDEDR